MPTIWHPCLMVLPPENGAIAARRWHCRRLRDREA